MVINKGHQLLKTSFVVYLCDHQNSILFPQHHCYKIVTIIYGDQETTDNN